MTTDLVSTDPCPCLSGLPYGDCHEEINGAAPDKVLDVGRAQYARRWKGNSVAYERQGVYQKLAQHLVPTKRAARIIDIGCGRGEGLSALRDATIWPGSFLLGIDENPACLSAAAQRLKIAEPDERLVRVGGAGREYDLKVLTGRLPAHTPVMLAQSDLLRPDPELDELIARSAPYDAVTLWFTGIHPARQHDTEVKRQELKGDSALRMATDLAALEYAGAMVGPDGRLQIAVRGLTTDVSTFRGQVESEMRSLAEHGPATLIDLLIFSYQEPSSGERIGLGAIGVSIPDKAQAFVASAIFRINA